MSDEKIELSGEADYRFLSLVMSLATATLVPVGESGQSCDAKNRKGPGSGPDLDRVYPHAARKDGWKFKVRKSRK